MTTILTQAFQLWPKLKTWEKVTAIILLLVVLAVVVWVKVLQPAASGGWWEVLVDSGILTTVITGVFSLLSKFIGAKASQTDDAANREGMIEMEGTFVELDAGQWLFTLHVALLSGLMGAIVAGFLFGSVSLWVNGFALAVIGALIAWLSKGVLERLPEYSYTHPNYAHRPRRKMLRLSKYLGLSTLPPALLALLCGCLGTSSPLSSVGQYAVWIYFVYGILIGLPSIHVLQWVARHMNPIRRSAGMIISGGYLVSVFLTCVIVSCIIGKYNAPESVRTVVLGTWEEVGAGKATADFTKEGQALFSNWLEEGDTWAIRYRFTSKTQMRLFDVDFGDEHYWGFVEILSDTEIVVNYKGAKKLTKAGQSVKRKEAAPAVAPEVVAAFRNTLVGEWAKVSPTHGYNSQIVFFSKSGALRYLGTKERWPVSESNEEKSGKYEVIDESKIRIGKQTISFDFPSEDEFIAQCYNRAGGSFQEVDGKFRRVKPFDSSKLKQQIVGRWAATFPEGTVSYEFDSKGNATIFLPGQRPSKATYTIMDNTIRMRHTANDNILTLTVLSISDNEATFKVQGANEAVFRRTK